MPNETTPLNGKVALITGASRGIGAETAKLLAAKGVHVVLVARTVGALEAVDDAIKQDEAAKQHGGQATLVPMDLLKLDQIDQLAGHLAERFGKLDILIGNAGKLSELRPIADTPNKQWERSLTLNLEANFRLIRAMHPLLLKSESGAHAIFLTSARAHSIKPFWGNLAIPKAALEAMVKTYAAEVEHVGIRATLFDPGETGTDFLKPAFPGKDIAAEYPPAYDAAKRLEELL